LCSEQLLQTTESLGSTLGEIASLNLQAINVCVIRHRLLLYADGLLQWTEVRSILLRAVSFLCQLKTHLHGFVHFFEKINALVGVTMRAACDEFISLIDDASRANKSMGGVTLSNWTRQVCTSSEHARLNMSNGICFQAIYEQALSAAKISKLVEKISSVSTGLVRPSYLP